MLIVNRHIRLADREIEITPIRAQGPGGQNVNKVASAVQLRFDIARSSLPDPVKQALLTRRDRRIGKDGVLTIKANEYRSQDMNRQAAIQRLAQLIREAAQRPKARVATKPSRSSRLKRLDNKTRRGQTKALRRKVHE